MESTETNNESPSEVEHLLFLLKESLVKMDSYQEEIIKLKRYNLALEEIIKEKQEYILILEELKY